MLKHKDLTLNSQHTPKEGGLTSHACNLCPVGGMGALLTVSLAPDTLKNMSQENKGGMTGQGRQRLL